MFEHFRVPVSCSQELRSPSLWALTLLCLGLTLGLIGISPFGISNESGSADMFLETAFLAGLAGCCLGTLRVDRARTILIRAPQDRRFWFELGTLGTGALLATLFTTVPIALAAGTQPPLLPTCLVLAHTTALALFLVRLELRPGTAGLLLPLLAWITPAFLGASDPRLLVRVLRAALDPTQNAALFSTAESTAGPFLASILPIVALLGLRVTLGNLQRINSHQ